ncbi:hypothetical protein C8A01DRAFT_48787 [Parachaetomium inaequale]|uniref:Uncharacterized protein n=1 Tax=Parachaetomium inaequale TaxID=2588326 RepID=A0AAN6PDX3_9PEZI|nr:hypothetical protein C8A01DRAFT_48787 [Parachaetomium inaequale]
MSSRVGKRQSKKGQSSKQRPSKPDAGERFVEERKPAYLNVYCAVYAPHFGNYYHWAFAISNPPADEWHLFEVAQDRADGPFRPEYRRVNPTNSDRCQLPLTLLGQMHSGWLSTLVEHISVSQVPGEAQSWNRQDYVMEIWEIMQQTGMVNFGGEVEDQVLGDDEELEDGEEGEQRILSKEFVYDSSE